MTYKTVTACVGVALIYGVSLAAAEPATPTVPKPLPKEISEVWNKAGATTGWYGFSESKRSAVFQSSEATPQAGWQPAFRFRKGAEVDLKAIPAPSEPFMIDFGDTKLTDVGMKQLALFGKLASLSLRKT